MTLLTLNQAAEFLQLHPNRLRLKVVKDSIPHKRIGNGPKARYRFLKEVLEEWIKGNTFDVDPRRINGGSTLRIMPKMSPAV